MVVEDKTKVTLYKKTVLCRVIAGKKSVRYILKENNDKSTVENIIETFRKRNIDIKN
jgi:hypothetical protein